MPYMFSSVICKGPCYMVAIPPITLPTNIFVVPVNRFEILLAVTVSNVIHSDIILCSLAARCICFTGICSLCLWNTGVMH